jgi:hypothetical protein
MVVSLTCRYCHEMIVPSRARDASAPVWWAPHADDPHACAYSASGHAPIRVHGLDDPVAGHRVLLGQGR